MRRSDLMATRFQIDNVSKLIGPRVLLLQFAEIGRAGSCAHPLNLKTMKEVSQEGEL